MTSTPEDDLGARGSGRTSRQIAASAHCGLYIAPSSAAVRYTEALARMLNRHSLTVVSLEAASRAGWERTRGLRGPSAVTLDHACWGFMTRTQKEEFRWRQRAFGW